MQTRREKEEERRAKRFIKQLKYALWVIFLGMVSMVMLGD